MSLADFERRMLRLKGIKLPAVGVVDTKHSKYAHQATIINNSSYGKILADIDQEYVVDEALDDIIIGVVRSFTTATSHKGNKLNVAVIRNMLHKLPIISQLSIMDNFGYGRQQASKYLQACKLVIQFKERYVIKCSLVRLSQYSME